MSQKCSACLLLALQNIQKSKMMSHVLETPGHSSVPPVSMHFVLKFVFPGVSIDLKGWIGSSTDYWSPPASSLQLALPINLAPNEANYRSEAFMG